MLGHAVPVSCHKASVLQVCGCEPLHLFFPAVHAPEQDPPVQAFAQAAPEFCQFPVASQICG
jgi:hypothetical protein